MTITARHALPLLVPGQAQKEMMHNEALTLIDLMMGAAVESVGAEQPPEAPLLGQCWILGADPVGEWAGHARALAGWSAGGWRFVAPREGMRVWAGLLHGFAIFGEGEWRVGELHGKVFIGGNQVVGERCPAIAEPSGGEVVDGPARAAITAVLNALRAHGLVDPDQL
jgi:hypothetical protein